MKASHLVPLCFIQVVSEGICHTSGRTYITTVSHLVPQYKCRRIPKTSELTDSRYGEKYKARAGRHNVRLHRGKRHGNKLSCDVATAIVSWSVPGLHVCAQDLNK